MSFNISWNFIFRKGKTKCSNNFPFAFLELFSAAIKSNASMILYMFFSAFESIKEKKLKGKHDHPIETRVKFSARDTVPS